MVKFYTYHVCGGTYVYHFTRRTAEPLGAPTPPGCDESTSLISCYSMHY